MRRLQKESVQHNFADIAWLFAEMTEAAGGLKSVAPPTDFTSSRQPGDGVSRQKKKNIHGHSDQ